MTPDEFNERFAAWTIEQEDRRTELCTLIATIFNAAKTIVKGETLEEGEWLTPEQLLRTPDEEAETDNHSIDAFFAAAAAKWGPK